VANYYAGWGSIVLRAYRLRKIFDCYDEHFQRVQERFKLEKDIDSLDLSVEENEKISEKGGKRFLKSMREWELLKWMYVAFIVPNVLFGAVAVVVPYIYAFIPVYETDQCMSFYV